MDRSGVYLGFIIFVVLGIYGCNADFKTEYMNQKCNQNLGERLSGRLETSTALQYDNLVNCYTTVSVESGKKVFLHFKRFDVEEKVNGACVDKTNVHDGGSISDANINSEPLCGYIEDYFNLTSTSNKVTFHFTSDNTAVFRGFEVIYVGYTNAPCASGQFSCGTGICIDASLECNDEDECGDGSDEAACSEEDLAEQEDELNLGLIIGLVVAGVILIIIAIIVGYKVYMWYKWKKWYELQGGHRYPWDDDSLYAYPVTDRYNIYEIGIKGRRTPAVPNYFSGAGRGITGNVNEGGKYIDEY